MEWVPVPQQHFLFIRSTHILLFIFLLLASNHKGPRQKTVQQQLTFSALYFMQCILILPYDRALSSTLILKSSMVHKQLLTFSGVCVRQEPFLPHDAQFTLICRQNLNIPLHLAWTASHGRRRRGIYTAMFLVTSRKCFHKQRITENSLSRDYHCNNQEAF